MDKQTNGQKEISKKGQTDKKTKGQRDKRDKIICTAKNLKNIFEVFHLRDVYFLVFIWNHPFYCLFCRADFKTLLVFRI